MQIWGIHWKSKFPNIKVYHFNNVNYLISKFHTELKKISLCYATVEMCWISISNIYKMTNIKLHLQTIKLFKASYRQRYKIKKGIVFKLIKMLSNKYEYIHIEVCEHIYSYVEGEIIKIVIIFIIYWILLHTQPI